MRKKIISLLLILPFSVLQAAQPKLIVQIVVDQLRGDLLQKYQNQFGAQGFNYLINNGISYRNTQHPQANTVTCVGHATIATGAYPAQHGIIDNNWYLRKQDRETYCVEDLQTHILSWNSDQKLNHEKSAAGRSPKHLETSTFSDELILAQKGRAFAVAFKDRSAITLAGHAGKAFWFDQAQQGFVSSSYYYKSYPQWVIDWNKKHHFVEENWRLSRAFSSYQFANAPKLTTQISDYGVEFPHHLGKPSDKHYFELLALSPVTDETTADFAIHLLQDEHLGKQAKQTDYLGVSFSSVDKIGHQFGPNSVESEENLIRLDKTLTRFLSAIDQQVGLQHTLIILTADHGISDSGPYLKQKHMPTHPVFSQQRLEQVMMDRLTTQFDLPAETLQQVAFPYVYLNHGLIAQHHLSVKEVSDALCESLREHASIYTAYSLPLTDATDWLAQKVALMAHPKRVGDIYLVSKPYQQYLKNDNVRVNHGSLWRYDSYVPLIFTNPSFKTKQVYRASHTTDIAPTLSAILGINAPSGSVGQPLREVMRNFAR